MSDPNLSFKQLSDMINMVMGGPVLEEDHLKKIMDGAKTAHEKGGMNSVLEYLMKVTQADVEMGQLTKFAESVQSNPELGMSILQGKAQITSEVIEEEK